MHTNVSINLNEEGCADVTRAWTHTLRGGLNFNVYNKGSEYVPAPPLSLGTLVERQPPGAVMRNNRALAGLAVHGGEKYGRSKAVTFFVQQTLRKGLHRLSSPTNITLNLSYYSHVRPPQSPKLPLPPASRRSPPPLPVSEAVMTAGRRGRFKEGLNLIDAANARALIKLNKPPLPLTKKTEENTTLNSK